MRVLIAGLLLALGGTGCDTFEGNCRDLYDSVACGEFAAANEACGATGSSGYELRCPNDPIP